VWEAGGRNAAGNGSLMRTAPIGVFFASISYNCVRPRVRTRRSHFDERCQQACVAFTRAIATAI